MRIAFVYTKGHPAAWADRAFEGRALGGSEACMILYAQAFAQMGHEVCIYTPGVKADRRDGIEWNDIKYGMYLREFDVAIALRFPNALSSMLAPLRVLFCCDPEVPDLPHYVDQGYVNLVITISKHQRQRYQKQHPIREDLYLDSNAGVAYADYVPTDVPKIPGRCIYCSVPDRGLDSLVKIWPMIHRELPWAILHVTGGFELWGMDIPLEKQPSVIQLLTLKGTKRLGTLPRKELIREQLQSQVLLLPGALESPEMCCISAMECAAAGNALIVGDIAALPERVIDGKTGYIIKQKEGWLETFAQKAIEVLTDPNLPAMQTLAREKEREHDYSILASQWIERFEAELSAQR